MYLQSFMKFRATKKKKDFSYPYVHVHHVVPNIIILSRIYVQRLKDNVRSPCKNKDHNIFLIYTNKLPKRL